MSTHKMPNLFINFIYITIFVFQISLILSSIIFGKLNLLKPFH